MKKLSTIAVSLAVVAFMGAGLAYAASGGYNYTARIFNGTYDQWCEAKLGQTQAYCDAYLYPYGNDKLVMKWNAQWDNCNAAGNDSVDACLGAWLDNEFNGKFPGGSGEIWHYKIIWVGSEESTSPYWVPGGEAVWGSYEILMDQGFDPNVGPGHIWFAHTTPNGYGAK